MRTTEQSTVPASVHEIANMADWRPVHGQPGFSVTRDGRVHRLSDGRPIPSRKAGKYLIVDIDGRMRTLHRVVCESFHGPPPCEGCEVHHKDRNKLNPHADNLEWKTPAEHRAEHGQVNRCGDRPPKPRPDFPLFANQNGQWCKKIHGKHIYFGSWCTDRAGGAALARFEAFQEERPAVATPTIPRHRANRPPRGRAYRLPRQSLQYGGGNPPRPARLREGGTRRASASVSRGGQSNAGK